MQKQIESQSSKKVMYEDAESGINESSFNDMTSVDLPSQQNIDDFSHQNSAKFESV